MARTSSSLGRRLSVLLLILAGALAWLYRSSELAKRPMHTDEAILGMKTIDLWKSGHFQYDPHDYHGPLLHYSTIGVGRLLGWNPENVTEENLRLVTAIYGMGLIIIAMLLADVISVTGCAFAALFIAVSPMMTFYSRYYIMETPLVFFCGLFIASLWRWSQSKNILWLILAGFSLGTMHATKETCVLNLAALAAGCLAASITARFFTRRSSDYLFRDSKPNFSTAWIVVPLVALVVSAAWYSNFFKDWQYLRDSFLTYKNYLSRSAGSGHEKPWNYYFTLLFWGKNALHVWTEALIGGLAVIGIISAFFNTRRPAQHRTFLIILSVYAMALLVIYSLIPYKTPWAILAVDHALALLAGVGVASLYNLFQWPLIRVVLTIGLTMGIYNLCRQTSLATDFNKAPGPNYSVHDLNPYVYSHTTPKLVELARQVHQLADLHPEGNKMPVQVIQSESGWPLPWYLRDMPHVGYQSGIPANLDAAVIIMDQDKQDDVLSLITPRAMPIDDLETFVGPPEPPRKPQPIYEPIASCSLRPGVVMNVLVEKYLWTKFQETQNAKP